MTAMHGDTLGGPREGWRMRGLVGEDVAAWREFLPCLCPDNFSPESPACPSGRHSVQPFTGEQRCHEALERLRPATGKGAHAHQMGLGGPDRAGVSTVGNIFVCGGEPTRCFLSSKSPTPLFSVQPSSP